jgi:hypothetical protein
MLHFGPLMLHFGPSMLHFEASMLRFEASMVWWGTIVDGFFLNQTSLISPFAVSGPVYSEPRGSPLSAELDLR